MATSAVGILQGVAADRWAWEPDLVEKWVAAHRGLVRVAFLLFVASWLIFAVLKTIDDSSRWHLFLLAALFASQTWQFGWYIPRRVDKWDNAQR